ncbi:MAG TPA: BON domain-containing protein [Gemmatimonadaceae bacterium]|nr:BON domain-containing protein [Gemmatimonadaceae bacterium]
MPTLKQDVQRLMSDHEISRDVREELHFDPSVTDAGSIDVSVRDGVVTLGGIAGSLAQRWAIVRAVERVRGVRHVIDALAVMYPKTERRADSDIEDAANVALKWDARVPEGVAASVTDGVLTLRGAVANAVERGAAFDAVRNIIGLRGISNEIEVVPRAAAPDLKESLTAAVRRRIDSDGVRVEVDGGTVVLSGTVSSYAEREEIEQAAVMARGVVAVDDRLRVAP